MNNRYQHDFNKRNRHLLSLKFIVSVLLQFIARKFVLPPRSRVFLQNKRKVVFTRPDKVFISENVYFDLLYPENITVGENVIISANTIILTHYYDSDYKGHVFRIGNVIIEDDVFIGANVIVSNSVTIGKGSIVGSNSVVTRDVPPFSIVAGSLAKVIGNRGSCNNDNIPHIKL